MMHHSGNKIKDFTVKEFSEDPHRHADPQLMLKTQEQRDIIGAPMRPSPTPGALARFGVDNAYSMHFSSKTIPSPDGRYSTALDWFCDAPAFTTWNKIITSNLWQGMGIYFDTHYKNEQKIMYHTDFDRGDSVAYWFRYYKKDVPGGVYVDSKNDKDFWEKLYYFFYLNYKKKDFEGWEL